MTGLTWNRALLGGLGLVVLVIVVGVSIYVYQSSQPLPATLRISRIEGSGVDLDENEIQTELPFLALAFQQAGDAGSSSLSESEARDAIRYLRDATGNEDLGVVSYDGESYRLRIHRDIR